MPSFLRVPVVLLSLLMAAAHVVAGPPSLPPGLGGGPALPPGLGSAGDNAGVTESEDEDEDAFAEFNGFWEYRYGNRVRDTSLHDDQSINETRIHLAVDKSADRWTLETGVDLLYDDLVTSHDIDLEDGTGWLDLRKLSLLWKVGPSLDVRIGRQVITWGTGDMVFLNDLFPKDWRYYLGRDIEYLKAPSDALKLSWYNDLANVDLVYAPRFDASRYLSGERLSFYNNNLGRRAGRDDIISVDKPDEWFEDDEVALRVYRNINGMELAMYGFDGFYKSPLGFDTATNLYTFPRLTTFGASMRRPFGPGILSLEAAYWKSKDDPDGDDPMITNGETRVLAGYEWEAARDFTVNIQYYAEHMHDYDNYRANLSAGEPLGDDIREIITLRLTRFLLSQNLKLSWFNYYTPGNGDLYINPVANYQVNDDWAVEVGGTWFDVRDNQPYAPLGQFKYNNNIYVMVRYSFAGAVK